MNLRRAAPFVFAALCLGLSGFVLRGQIAAHPKPPSEADGLREDFRPQLPPGLPRANDHPPGWRAAAEPTRAAVTAVIGDQLAAIRTGDADRAWSYQSRGLHRGSSSAQEFQSSIADNYPEFGHSQSVSYGPVWADPSGTHVGVAVTVRGLNGRSAPAYYLLIKEGDDYKVASVMGGRAGR